MQGVLPHASCYAEAAVQPVEMCRSRVHVGASEELLLVSAARKRAVSRSPVHTCCSSARAQGKT